MFENNLKKFFFSFIIVLIIFAFDRFSKFYILNLAEAEKYVDIYFNSFLNFHLIWNTGIGFGLFSSGANFYYNLITIKIISKLIIEIKLLLYSNLTIKLFYF